MMLATMEKLGYRHAFLLKCSASKCPLHHRLCLLKCNTNFVIHAYTYRSAILLFLDYAPSGATIIGNLALKQCRYLMRYYVTGLEYII